MSTQATESKTSNQQFFRLQAAGIERSREDEFTALCFEIGASGVAEELQFVQPDLVYEAEAQEPPYLTANVFFAEAPAEDLLLKIQGEFPEARLERFTEENRDWLAEWKKDSNLFCFQLHSGSFQAGAHLPKKRLMIKVRYFLLNPEWRLGRVRMRRHV